MVCSSVSFSSDSSIVKSKTAFEICRSTTFFHFKNYWETTWKHCLAPCSAPAARASPSKWEHRRPARRPDDPGRNHLSSFFFPFPCKSVHPKVLAVLPTSKFQRCPSPHLHHHPLLGATLVCLIRLKQ